MLPGHNSMKDHIDKDKPKLHKVAMQRREKVAKTEPFLASTLSHVLPELKVRREVSSHFSLTMSVVRLRTKENVYVQSMWQKC